MGRRFKVGIVVLFLLLFNLPKSGYSQALTETVISVEPSSSSVETCLNQTIAIQVQDVVDLTGYHLEIGFDPAAIQVTDVVNGGFLDDVLENVFYEPTNTIDNVTGKIVFGMVQQNDASFSMTPKSGTGNLILITFEAVTWNMNTNITIDPVNSMLVDWPDAFEIPLRLSMGQSPQNPVRPQTLCFQIIRFPRTNLQGRWLEL